MSPASVRWPRSGISIPNVVTGRRGLISGQPGLRTEPGRRRCPRRPGSPSLGRSPGGHRVRQRRRRNRHPTRAATAQMANTTTQMSAVVAADAITIGSTFLVCLHRMALGCRRVPSRPVRKLPPPSWNTCLGAVGRVAGRPRLLSGVVTGGGQTPARGGGQTPAREGGARARSNHSRNRSGVQRIQMSRRQRRRYSRAVGIARGG